MISIVRGKEKKIIIPSLFSVSFHFVWVAP